MFGRSTHDRSRDPVARSVVRATRFASYLALVAILSGCGLMYRSNVRGAHWVIYSNRGDEFTANVDARVREIYDAYGGLFEVDAAKLGMTKILLDGEDDGVLDHGYTPSLLGYYVPLFNFIRIDTEPAWARDEESLTQVLLHEIAHHFLVTKHPRVADRCWLNEGLAGNLEVSRILEGRVEHPLVHPVLVRLAQKHLRSRARGVSIGDLIGMSWSEFHDSEDKVAHYALSWALVYYLLEVASPPGDSLGTRIERVVGLSASELVAHESAWRTFIERFDLTEHLLSLAEDASGRSPLTRSWAIQQLGELYSLDDVRAILALSRLIDIGKDADHAGACRSFLRVVQRNPHAHYVANETSRRSLEHIARIVGNREGAPALRGALIDAIDATTPERESWIRVLVGVLSDPQAAVRIAAAGALGRIGAKPTIVSPHFWHFAPASAREREVGEWRAWLLQAPPSAR